MEEKAELKIKEANEYSIDNSEKLEDVPIEPFEVNCEFCNKKVTTCVKREYNSTIFPYILIILYFYGIFYGSIVILLTILLFQNIIHLCPACSGKITYKSFYPIKQKIDKYFKLQDFWFTRIYCNGLLIYQKANQKNVIKYLIKKIIFGILQPRFAAKIIDNRAKKNIISYKKSKYKR